MAKLTKTTLPAMPDMDGELLEQANKKIPDLKEVMCKVPFMMSDAMLFTCVSCKVVLSALKGALHKIHCCYYYYIFTRT